MAFLKALASKSISYLIIVCIVIFPGIYFYTVELTIIIIKRKLKCLQKILLNMEFKRTMGYSPEVCKLSTLMHRPS